MKLMNGTDVLLLLGGSILSVFLAVAVGYTITGVSNEAQAQACEPSDYAHVPYPDEYVFECNENELTVYDASTGELIATEERCQAPEIKAEDGTCVNEDYYNEDNGGDLK